MTFMRCATLVALLLPNQQAELRLVTGMELTYASNGTANAPWRVESVERDVELGGRTGCVRVRYFPGGPRATADVRLSCEFDGMVHSWSQSTMRWVATLPVTAGGTLTTRSGSAEQRYAAGATTVDTIAGHPVRVIETTIVTTDSLQRPVRRLRERYAPALGTATWGAF